MNDEGYQPTDRRPINSRNTGWARKITTGLVSANITPNSISIFGMVAAIIAGAMFGLTSMTEGLGQRSLWLLGGLLCQIRLLCNLFDGMVAIEQKTASPVGELYNEVPDRISDAAIFIGLGYAISGDVVLGLMAALLAVFTAYVRATAKSVGASNDFCGPMAKPQRMALTTILAVFMGFAPTVWRESFSAPRFVLWVVVLGCAVTSIRRLMRAAAALKNRNSQ